MNPTLTLIAAGITATLGFTSAWQMQAHTITKINLEGANERISLQQAARQNAERYATQISTAQANATNRGVVLRAAVDRTRDVGDGLRIKTAAAVRAAASDPAACSDTAAALGVVFAEAVGELETLAASADRHASDAQTLVDAWPR